jgi:uncharacterized Zn finger protein
VQALVEEQPELIDAVDRQVMLLSNPAPPNNAVKSRRRAPIDVALFKRQVKHILREGVRSLEEGYEDDPFSDDLLDVIKKAVAFSRNDDGESAIAILTAIMALAIAQAGLPLPGNCRYPLASWTSELAEGLGNHAVALEASVLAFKLHPSFADYQRVEHFAASQWNDIKPDLLGTLRQSQDWQAREAKVDIFLHEGLLDDAIKAVESDSYYRSDSVHRVMQAVVSTHPDWVIAAARQRAEPIMEQGKADRYSEAVQWLRQVKAAYVQLGQQAIWSTYFSQLQSTHARKRKLMDLFKQLR